MIGRDFNILLVEDDEIDVVNIRRAFRRCETAAPLLVAGDGREALRLLRGGIGRGGSPPRWLVLLDLNLPRAGGFGFLREMRADPRLRSLPVVVLTGSDADCDKVSALDLNVARCVVKPVTMGALVKIVGRLRDYWDANAPPPEPLVLA